MAANKGVDRREAKSPAALGTVPGAAHVPATRPIHRDVVVVGGSAGALDPLKQIVSDLPRGLPAAVVVALHLASSKKSALAHILTREGKLPAEAPRDGDPLKPGRVYVATPNHHLELTGTGIKLSHGPRINGMRPAIDVLFRSAAAAFGARVIGVVLSGGLDDGSAGLAAIRAAGGVAIVQLPDEALIDSMPWNAIQVAAPEHILPAASIASTIVQLVRNASEPGGAARKMGETAMEPVGAGDAPGEVTGITCPECHGSIWLQGGENGDIALTCRVGHSYSPESFYEMQSGNVENALWAGVRSLEEQAALASSMASRASKTEDDEGRAQYERRAKIASQNAGTLRKLILERS